MEISVEKIGVETNVSVIGSVSTIDDSAVLKKHVNEAFDGEFSNRVNLSFIDSYVMTSSLIGYFIKLVRTDKANIVIIIHDTQLYNLIERLNLIDILNVRRG